LEEVEAVSRDMPGVGRVVARPVVTTRRREPVT